MWVKNPIFKKILTWILGLILFIIGVLGALSLWINYQYQDNLKKEIKLLVYEASGKLYTLDFSAISINLLFQSATLSNATLQADTAVYSRLINNKTAPDNLYNIHLKELYIKRFNIFQLLLKNKLLIQELLFEKPTVVMINKRQVFNEFKKPIPLISPYNFISKFLEALKIDKINFHNAAFKYQNNNGPVVKLDSVAKVNILLEDYLIDAYSAMDTTRHYLFKSFKIYLKDYTYHTSDSLYKLHLDVFSFNSIGGLLEINNFQIQPRFSKAEFGKRIGHASERVDLSISKMQMDGFNLPMLLKRNKLIADSLSFRSVNVEVFTDNKFPKRLFDKKGRFPHQLLQKAPVEIEIPKLKFDNVSCSYSSNNRLTNEIGTVFFTNTQGSFLNLTNTKDALQKDSILRFNATTRLMGSGLLKLQMNFNLMAKNGYFDYSGTMGPIDGRVLNKLVGPLAMIEVRRGKGEELKFNIQATDQEAKGEMLFKYEGLALSVMRKDRNDDKLKKRGFASFLVNNMLIESQNPRLNGQFEREIFTYQKPSTISFFSYIWRTLFVGLKSSVGITLEKEHSIREKVIDFERILKDRANRKDARKTRRFYRDFNGEN